MNDKTRREPALLGFRLLLALLIGVHGWYRLLHG